MDDMQRAEYNRAKCEDIANAFVITGG